MIDILVKLFVGIAIAIASSWFTVHLTRRQFQTNRWWEKKVEAYERVIDAFHNAKKFASENLDAEYYENEVPKDRDSALRKLSKDAHDEITRASDIGSFILSQEALRILAKFQKESENLHTQPSWHEYLDAEWSITNSHMKEFIEEAHRDLKR